MYSSANTGNCLRMAIAESVFYNHLFRPLVIIHFIVCEQHWYPLLYKL